MMIIIIIIIITYIFPLSLQCEGNEMDADPDIDDDTHICLKCRTTIAGTSHHINPLNPELNPICYLLALLGAHHFLHVSRIRVKLLTFRILMSYIYGAPILDVSRSHTTTQHSR